ncbi:MAG: hypothetical protein ACRD13_15325 [Terriglobales bacterium]
MSQAMFVAENPTEALLLEQALVFARQLTRVANDAPDGHVLALAEKCILSQGRAFLQQALQTVLQAQAPEVEKKGRPFDAVPADNDATTKASRGNKR